MDAYSNQELLFATILDIVPGKASKSIKFRYVTSGKESDHCWSDDKNKWRHCYGDLEIGCTYVIVIQKLSKGRWVWLKARHVTPKQAIQFHKITGVTPEIEEMEVAIEWLNAVQQPKKEPPKPDLTDLLVIY